MSPVSPGGHQHTTGDVSSSSALLSCDGLLSSPDQYFHLYNMNPDGWCGTAAAATDCDAVGAAAAAVVVVVARWACNIEGCAQGVRAA